MATDTLANASAFAEKIALNDLHTGTGVSIPNPDDPEVVTHIMPDNMDEVKRLAENYGMELKESELDRRVFVPKGE